MGSWRDLGVELFFFEGDACKRIEVNDRWIGHEDDVVNLVAPGCWLNEYLDDRLAWVEAPLDTSIEGRNSNNFVWLRQQHQSLFYSKRVRYSLDNRSHIFPLTSEASNQLHDLTRYVSQVIRISAQDAAWNRSDRDLLVCHGLQILESLCLLADEILVNVCLVKNLDLFDLAQSLFASPLTCAVQDVLQLEILSNLYKLAWACLGEKLDNIGWVLRFSAI